MRLRPALIAIPLLAADTCYSAEWDGDICEKYAVDDWSQAVLRDSSMSDKRGKDRAMTLAQCMNLFTTEEKLGEDDPWWVGLRVIVVAWYRAFFVQISTRIVCQMLCFFFKSVERCPLLNFAPLWL